MRKKGSKNKEYSAEFKIGVIMDMREHHLGYRETVRKYCVRQGTVLCLERNYLKYFSTSPFVSPHNLEI